MSFLLITIALAVLAGYILFKIYNFILSQFLKKMEWSIEDLKDYKVTKAAQQWEKIAQGLLLVLVFYKVYYGN